LFERRRALETLSKNIVLVVPLARESGDIKGEALAVRWSGGILA
jgi:hypothetical protein